MEKNTMKAIVTPKLSLERPMKMQRMPSSVWVLHKTQRRPRIPNREDAQSERIPPTRAREQVHQTVARREDAGDLE